MQPFTLHSSTITADQLAKAIDHSLLRPELTEADVISGCDLADHYRVASVCCKPCHVRLAADRLASSEVLVGTVVGFPHGSNTTAIKAAETNDALENGAEEFDMVLNIAWLKDGRTLDVERDIEAVVKASDGCVVKVILENAYLTHDEKVLACKIVESAGAHFVKTSTGFAPSGATVEDIVLMRASVGPNVQVKAAGGIRSLESFLAMIDAGATRIGATATKAMLDAFAEGHRSAGASTDTSGY